jgi:hypothetical protein
MAHAIRAVWLGLVAPSRVDLADAPSSIAVFAMAVLVLTVANTASTYIETSNSQLRTEAVMGSPSVANPPAQSGQIDLTTPQRVFTANLGLALITTIVSLVLVALMLMFLHRFLTNQQSLFSTALAAVSATALIDLVRVLAYAVLHNSTGTMRWGLHAGVFVTPAQAPFLFAFLKRLDVVTWWQYVVMAMVLARNTGLHHRYGLVVGSVVFLAMLIAVGGFALVGWIVQLSAPATG